MESQQIAIASLWVAGASSMVAVASLSWQIVNALSVDRARLSVSVTNGFLSTSGQEIVTVDVTNYGRRPTKVTNVMLAIGRKPQRWLPRRQRRHVQLLPHSLPGLSAPLPRTVDVGESVNAVYDADVVRMAIRENEEHAAIYGLMNSTTAGTRYSRLHPFEAE